MAEEILDPEDEKEILHDMVKFLEDNSEYFCYIDDYKIFVTPYSTEPVIVMGIEEFQNIEKKVLGENIDKS